MTAADRANKRARKQLKFYSYTLPGSDKFHPEARMTAFKDPTPLDPKTEITFSVFAPIQQKKLDSYLNEQLRRIANGDIFGGRIESKELWISHFGATAEAMKRAAKVVKGFGLTVVSTNRRTGELVVRGILENIKRLIPNLELSEVELNGSKFRMRSGEYRISVPANRGRAIVKIQGLDNVPLAGSYYKLNNEVTVKNILARPTQPKRSTVLQSALKFLDSPTDSDGGAFGPFSPFELMSIFNVPDNTGAGQKIGIIALGGGFDVQDATDYAHNVLKVKGKVDVQVRTIDGATNTPDPQGADIETALDVDGSLGAPGATIIVVIANNTSLSFAHGIGTLIDMGCDIITISWGVAEAEWTQQGIDTMHTEFARAFAAGVSVYAAAGDNLSPDNVPNGMVNTDYPSTDPLVMSMIGLWLSKDGKTFRIWNRHDPLRGDSGSGGGVSDVFPVQEWEVGRQVLSLNDGQRRHWVGGFAGPADQGTGLLISYRNRVFGVGGTSADGPIYAGMTARLNAALGKRVGFYLPYVITTIANENASKLVTPVTEGNNIPTNGKGYQAQDLTPGMLNFGELKTRLEAQLKKNKRAA